MGCVVWWAPLHDRNTIWDLADTICTLARLSYNLPNSGSWRFTIASSRRRCLYAAPRVRVGRSRSRVHQIACTWSITRHSASHRCYQVQRYTTQERTDNNEKEERTMNKGRSSLCNVQCIAHRKPRRVLRPKSMSRHQCNDAVFPRLRQNPTVFHDLGKCRSCAPKGRLLQLSTQIAKYCHNVQCTTLKYYRVATPTTVHQQHHVWNCPLLVF